MCRLCWPGLGTSIVLLKGHRYRCLCEKLINIIYFFRGQSPADAEFNFLEVAKNLDLYGVDLHFAKVHKCIFIMLINEQPNLPIIIDTSLTLKVGFH